MICENGIKFRHEQKYIITSAESEIIKNRLKHLVLPDIHTDATGSYTIRSLYFDDYYNRCFYENQNGTDSREKWRIRIYNGSAERIMLECKRKEHGMTYKRSCQLSLEQTKLLMQGKALENIAGQPTLIRRFILEMLTRKLTPKVIVEYERIPYVYKNGNVRITLDTNVSSSDKIEDFLEKSIMKRPVMSINEQLLEVKFDEFLPDFIYNSLQLGNLRQTAFSKYYLCRKFSLRRIL